MALVAALILTHLAATAAVAGVFFWELYRHFFDGPCAAGTAVAAVLPLLIYPLGGWLARRRSLPAGRRLHWTVALTSGLVVVLVALFPFGRTLVLLPTFLPVYEITNALPSMGLSYDLRMSILEPLFTTTLQWGYLLLFWLFVWPRSKPVHN